jgi:hypothetical protein
MAHDDTSQPILIERILDPNGRLRKEFLLALAGLL